MSICGDQTPAWYYQATLWLEKAKGVDADAGKVRHTALNGEDMMTILSAGKTKVNGDSAYGEGIRDSDSNDEVVRRLCEVVRV